MNKALTNKVRSCKRSAARVGWAAKPNTFDYDVRSPVADVIRVACWASFHSAQSTRAGIFDLRNLTEIMLSEQNFGQRQITDCRDVESWAALVGR